MLQEQAWVRRTIRALGRRPPAHLAGRAFYVAAAAIDEDRLLVPDAAIPSVGPAEEVAIAGAWRAWNAHQTGQKAEALRQLQELRRAWPRRPEPYFMLALFALSEGNRKVAYKMLVRTLDIDKRYRAAADLLAEFGLRAPPALSFLDRTHPINVVIGRLRHRLKNSD